MMEDLTKLISEHGISVAFNVAFIIGAYWLAKYVIHEKAEAFEEAHERNYQIICDLIKRVNELKGDVTEVKSDIRVVIEIFKDKTK